MRVKGEKGRKERGLLRRRQAPDQDSCLGTCPLNPLLGE